VESLVTGVLVPASRASDEYESSKFDPEGRVSIAIEAIFG
jgi:hypothetical protein